MKDKFNTPSQLVIIGASGHAASLANVALSAGFDIKCFIDPKRAGETLCDIEIIDDLSQLINITDYSYAIAIGDNSTRESVHKKLIKSYGAIQFPTLIHSSAVLSVNINIGEGTVAMPNAVIGPNSKIGSFCIINTSSSIDHDCIMSDYASMAPSSVTGGRVLIGTRSAISIAASIKHGISIGSDTVIGGASYVEKNIGDNCVAYGVPAKVIKARNYDTPYL